MQPRMPQPKGSHGIGSPPAWSERIGAAWVTVAIIVVCVGAFLGTVGVCAVRAEAPSHVLLHPWLGLDSCGPTLDDFGALRLSSLWLDGSWWRVLSAGLLHGSVLHLVLNVWSLWVVGELAEAAWGHARTGVLFALSSVGGCLASAAWVEAPMVVGASAGIMGIAGAILVGRLIGRGRVASALEPLSARILGGWLVALVALGFFVDMIAQAGHLGGLLVGLLIGLAWSGQGAGVSLAGRVGVGMAITGMLLAARQPRGREGYYEFIGQGYLDRGQDLEAAAAYERALARRPDDARLANDLAYGLAKAGARLEDAERLVRGALEAEPNNAAYLDTLGWVLCRQGKVDAGLAELRRAVEASEDEDEEIEGHLRECSEVQVRGSGG